MFLNPFDIFVSGFNTQPPEGGCHHNDLQNIRRHSFNTQPPEGGWPVAALLTAALVCFNTQPPEGGWFRPDLAILDDIVSTHSRPKAADLKTTVL